MRAQQGTQAEQGGSGIVEERAEAHVPARAPLERRRHSADQGRGVCARGGRPCGRAPTVLDAAAAVLDSPLLDLVAAANGVAHGGHHGASRKGRDGGEGEYEWMGKAMDRRVVAIVVIGIFLTEDCEVRGGGSFRRPLLQVLDRRVRHTHRRKRSGLSRLLPLFCRDFCPGGVSRTARIGPPTYRARRGGSSQRGTGSLAPSARAGRAQPV